MQRDLSSSFWVRACVATLAVSCAYPTMEVVPDPVDHASKSGATGVDGAGKGNGGEWLSSGGALTSSLVGSGGALTSSLVGSGGALTSSLSGSAGTLTSLPAGSGGTSDRTSLAFVSGGTAAVGVAGASWTTWGGSSTSGSTSSPTAGSPSASTWAGTGCTGGYEAFDKRTGLCVAAMMHIVGPQESTSYEIDVTEVTHGQYQAWVKTTPALTKVPDRFCDWNDTYEMDYWCHTHYQVCTSRPDCDHHAAVCVDWCDAYSYCSAIGKRLCGAIGAGRLSAMAQADPALSQWYRACSSGGINKYPYGNEHQPTACNGLATWEGIGPATTVAVGSPTTKGCSSNVIGYASVYDLSGSVAEWEDNCEAGPNPSHGDDKCQTRGGSFDDLVDGSAGVDPLQCAVGLAAARAKIAANIGFRCCSL